MIGMLAPTITHKPAVGSAPTIPIIMQSVFNTPSTSDEYNTCMGGRPFLTTNILNQVNSAPEDFTAERVVKS